MKKFLSILLTIAMIASMSIVSMAATAEVSTKAEFETEKAKKGGESSCNRGAFVIKYKWIVML